MSTPSLTPEQQAHLDNHVAGIGHNQGPVFVEHAEHILDKAAQHHFLAKETTRIRVMLDMLRSHCSGEHLLPTETAAYVAGGLSLVAAITASSVAVSPVPTLLLDAPVVACVFAALHGHIEEYIDWRCAIDPSYASIRHELAGANEAR